MNFLYAGRIFSKMITVVHQMTCHGSRRPELSRTLSNVNTELSSVLKPYTLTVGPNTYLQSPLNSRRVVSKL